MGNGRVVWVVAGVCGLAALALVTVVVLVDLNTGDYEVADPLLGHALDDLRQAVVAVAEDSTCPDAEEKGCC